MADEETTAPPEADTDSENQGAGPEPDQGAGPQDTDWKAAARKHERRAKESYQRAQELEDRLSKIEEANKSESEKALDKARKEARKEAETEFDKERRSDRLAVAVARHARDLADVDDVVLNLKQGDIDELFDDEGRIDSDALSDRLATLLKSKPHLRAAGTGKPTGSADGGEGEGGGGTSLNDLIRAKRAGG